MSPPGFPRMKNTGPFIDTTEEKVLESDSINLITPAVNAESSKSKTISNPHLIKANSSITFVIGTTGVNPPHNSVSTVSITTALDKKVSDSGKYTERSTNDLSNNSQPKNSTLY